MSQNEMNNQEGGPMQGEGGPQQKFIMNPTVNSFSPATAPVYGSGPPHSVHMPQNYVNMVYPGQEYPQHPSQYMYPGHNGPYPGPHPNTNVPPPNVPCEGNQTNYPALPFPMYYQQPPHFIYYMPPPQTYVQAAPPSQEPARETLDNVETGRRSSVSSSSTAGDYSRNNMPTGRNPNSSSHTHLENCTINYNVYGNETPNGYMNNRNPHKAIGNNQHQSIPGRQGYPVHPGHQQPPFHDERRQRPMPQAIAGPNHVERFSRPMQRARTPINNGARYSSRSSRHSSCSDRNSVSNMTTDERQSDLNETHQHSVPNMQQAMPPPGYNQPQYAPFTAVNNFEVTGSPLIVNSNIICNGSDQMHHHNNNYSAPVRQIPVTTQQFVQVMPENRRQSVVKMPEMQTSLQQAPSIISVESENNSNVTELQLSKPVHPQYTQEIVQVPSLSTTATEEIAEVAECMEQLAIDNTTVEDASKFEKNSPVDSCQDLQSCDIKYESSSKIHYDESLVLIFGDFSSTDFKGPFGYVDDALKSNSHNLQATMSPVFDICSNVINTSTEPYSFTADVAEKEAVAKLSNGSAGLHINQTIEAKIEITQTTTIVNAVPKSKPPSPTPLVKQNVEAAFPSYSAKPAAVIHQVKPVAAAVSPITVESVKCAGNKLMRETASASIRAEVTSVMPTRSVPIQSTKVATQIQPKAAIATAVQNNNNVPSMESALDAVPTSKRQVAQTTSTAKSSSAVAGSAKNPSTVVRAQAVALPSAQVSTVQKEPAVPTPATKPTVKPAGMHVGKKRKQTEAAPVAESSVWNNNSPVNWSTVFKKVAVVNPLQCNGDAESVAGSTDAKEDGKAPASAFHVEKAKVGAFLKDYKPSQKSTLLTPRGLTNKNYWCYSNSVLQALLGVPQFVNLYRDLGDNVAEHCTEEILPVTHAIISFMRQISVMSNSTMSAPKNRHSGSNYHVPEVLYDDPFETTSIKTMLKKKNNSQFVEGSQQDAEEFLSFILNAGHDELVECLKLNDARVQGKKPGMKDIAPPQGVTMSDDNEEEEWLLQGPKKGKSCITRTTEVYPSPVSKVFWGENRSVVKKSVGSPTANIEPFVTLPLVIQEESIKSVKDALQHFVNKSDVCDYTCPETKEKVSVSNEGFLDHLPEVLAIQLKRFVYSADGGSQKIVKDVDVPVSLDINRSLMSPEVRKKLSDNKLKYKLVSIVYHDGKAATEGHYVANVYHPGYNCWINYDDACVKALPACELKRLTTHRVPYLLFYRRDDTFKDAVMPTFAVGSVPKGKNKAGADGSQDGKATEGAAKKPTNVVRKETLEKMGADQKGNGSGKQNNKGNKKSRKN